MQKFLTEMLQCPACRGALKWNITAQEGDQIEAGEARCKACGASYPIRQGIGVFLTGDLARNDLWEQVEGQLSQYLQAQPELEQRLMNTPLDSLSPADQYYRALVLEERGAFTQARVIFNAAEGKLYTPEYLICHESQVDYLLNYLEKGNGPIIDLASGRCDLVQEIARRIDRPVVATDFSLRILRRDRRWLEAFGLYRQVSLLALDARRTPFKDRSVQTMTTNAGLPNIEEPGDLLNELRRIVSGEFLAISPFYPETDEVNRRAIQQLGMESILFQANAQKQFALSGWKLSVVNMCRGQAQPTPRSQVLQGAGIDSLPVAATELEWVTLRAS